jgi:hypothetical protein
MQELDFQIRGENYSHIFASENKDFDGEDEVRLSIHILGGNLSTTMNLESARELAEALMQIVEAKS